MTTSSGNICILFITILFLGLTGCSGTRPDSFLDEENAGSVGNIETLKSIISKQGKKLRKLKKN